MNPIYRILLIVFALWVITSGMDRGRHVGPHMVRDGLAIATDGMVDTLNHENAHASVEVKP